MHIDIFRRLRDAVRRKRAEKLRTNSWFLLHDNAPAHRSVLVQDFLANNLAATNFHLYFRMKSAVKRRRCCNANYVIKNATEELKRCWQNGFQECFKHLRSRWQKSIVAQGENFQGNIAQIVVLCCISQEYNASWNILQLPCIIGIRNGKRIS